MAEIIFCDEWVMTVDSELLLDANNSRKALSSFFRSIYKYTTRVAGDVWCYYNTVKQLELYDVHSALELFAGAGMMSIMLRDLVAPNTHKLYDIDNGCVGHLSSMDFDADVIDAFKVGADVCGEYDFISLDCNATLIKLQSDPYSALFDVTLASGPDIVHLSDNALAYLHANGKAYFNRFGVEVSNIRDYINLMSKWSYDNYGYSVTVAYHTRHNLHMLLEYTKPTIVDIHKFTGDTHKWLRVEV